MCIQPGGQYIGQISLCLSRSCAVLKYLRQYSHIYSLGTWYSFGQGEKYQQSISYFPISIYSICLIYIVRTNRNGNFGQFGMILFDQSGLALRFLKLNTKYESVTFSLNPVSGSRGRFELFLLNNEILFAGTQPSIRLSSEKILQIATIVQSS